MLKKIIFTAVKFLIVVRRSILKPKGVVLLAPDIPKSNLGDQALLCGSIEGLAKQNFSKVLIVTSGPEEIPDTVVQRIRQSKFILEKRFPVFFATDFAFIEMVVFYWTVSKYQSVILVGADVLDGTYNAEEAARKINIISQCAKLGITTRIYGFSVSENISAESKKALLKLPANVQMYARDEISRKRIEKYFPCNLAADCAFLMKPSDLTNKQSFKKLLNWFKSDGLPVYGVCIRDKDIAAENSLDRLAEVLKIIAQNSNVKFLFVPHYPTDITVQRSLIERLNEISNSQHFIIDTLPLASEIKSIVAHCDHILTSRMHVAIAALGMKTPVTCIPYAGKFEGLLQHFELEKAILPIKKVNEPEEAASFLCNRLAMKSSIEAQIEKYLGSVELLSESSFLGLER